jgi:hypothetical protein
MTKHLGEEELIDLYYGAPGHPASAHLRACRACAAQYAELTQSMDSIHTNAVPQMGVQYGERVWDQLRPRLIPYEKRVGGWRRWSQWRAVTLSLACAMLVAAAFVGGRYWERRTAKTDRVAVSASPQAAQRTVLVILTDHLDRTERLLVALQHADPSDSVENAQLQSEARELLASNRLFRTTASSAGDPALAGALDRLEGVLAEIANNPNLSATDLERVRREMNTKGILFEIRVLRTRKPDQVNVPNQGTGASI